MKSLLATLLLVTLAVPADARGRRHSAAASPASRDEVAIAFVGVTGNGADAFVDAGVVMRKVVRRSFGVRLDAQGRMGIATLRAFLETSDDRSIIRIDGKRLTTVPTLIDAHAALGETTMHTIEIEVPAEVAEGAFASAVRWEVTVD